MTRPLATALLLTLVAAPAAGAGEWETLRDSYDGVLKTYARRVADIEARERGAPTDAEKRAEKITRDRIAGADASLKSGAKAKSLAEAGERAARDGSALPDMSRALGGYLDGAGSEWRADGAERRKMREALAALQKSLERATTSLDRTIEVAGATGRRVPQSGVAAKIQLMESEAKARASALREQAARDRERLQREREAAERERGVR
jgi:hypothetical protein